MGAVCKVFTGLPAGEGARAGAPRQPQTLCLPFRQHTATHVACPWHSTHTFSPLLSLQQEHVRVLGASVHILPDSLQEEQGAVRTRATPRHARPLKLVVPVPVGATRAPSLRSASKSETGQVPSKPPRALCSGLYLQPRSEPCSRSMGWRRDLSSHHMAILHLHPVCPPSPSPPNIGTQALVQGPHETLCRRQHTRSKALLSFSAAPPASHQAHGPGRQTDTVALWSTPSVHTAPPRQGTGVWTATWQYSSPGGLQPLGAAAFTSRSLSFKLPIFNQLLTPELSLRLQNA